MDTDFAHYLEHARYLKSNSSDDDTIIARLNLKGNDDEASLAITQQLRPLDSAKKLSRRVIYSL